MSFFMLSARGLLSRLSSTPKVSGGGSEVDWLLGVPDGGLSPLRRQRPTMHLLSKLYLMLAEYRASARDLDAAIPEESEDWRAEAPSAPRGPPGAETAASPRAEGRPQR